LERADDVGHTSQEVWQTLERASLNVRDGLDNSQVLYQQDIRENTRSGQDGGCHLEVDGEAEDVSGCCHQNPAGNSEQRCIVSARRRGRGRPRKGGFPAVLSENECLSDNRPVRVEVLEQNRGVLHAETRSASSSDRCFHSQLGRGSSLRLSTCIPLAQNSISYRRGRSSGTSRGRGRPRINGLRSLAPHGSRLDVSSSEVSNIPYQQIYGPSLPLDMLRDPWSVADNDRLDSETRRHISSSVSEVTRSRRLKIVQEFRKWLEDQNLLAFDGSHVLNYLSAIPESKMSEFATIRTAINTTVFQNSGTNYSTMELFQRQARGIQRLFPLDPKYESMWDVKTLWEFLKSNFWADKPKKKLRTKANILIRLSVAGRNGDVAHIHRSSITWGSNFFSFRFFQWKTQHTTRSRFSRYMTIRKAVDSHLCAYTAIREYFDLFKEDMDRINARSIWLSNAGSKEIMSSTLANCTRKVMREAGIDAIYGAATLRHAAITFWRDQGISIEEVMQRTGHRSMQLVLKYYDRSSIKNDIMANILDDLESDEEFE
jgi:integrase